MGDYSLYAKGRYGQALKELSKTYPLEKITVRMLAKKCGSSRQHFYYYFKDLYDLENWIYSSEIDKFFKTSSDEPFIIRLIRLYESIKEQRSFYKKLFSRNGQNSLVEHIVEHDRMLMERLILENDPSAVIDSQTIFAIDFYSCAAIYMTRYWLNMPVSTTPEEFSHALFSCMPALLKEKL